MWFQGEHGIELQMTKAQAQAVSHQGQCDADVLELSKQPKIARQLASLDPLKLRSELHEYGAWDDKELADHTQNLQRILWMAAGEIVEGRN
jgi:hypothetical protein